MDVDSDGEADQGSVAGQAKVPVANIENTVTVTARPPQPEPRPHKHNKNRMTLEMIKRFMLTGKMPKESSALAPADPRLEWPTDRWGNYIPQPDEAVFVGPVEHHAEGVGVVGKTTGGRMFLANVDITLKEARKNYTG